LVGPPLALLGYPEDGAVGVPTDVIPLYEAPSLGYADPEVTGPAFRLRRADGEEIPLVPSAPYTWNMAFAPEAELAPNTAYVFEATVRAHPDAEPTYLSAAFTTGDGRAAPPLPVRGASIQHYSVDLDGEPYSTCGAELHGTCVIVPPGSFVATSYVDSFDQEGSYRYLYREPFLTNLSGIDQGTNFKCVRLRTRAPNGAESEPVELCGANAPLREFSGSNEDVRCGPSGVTFEGESGGGCTIAPSGARHDAVWWSFGALLAAAAGFRRRRP
jgi:hypothetical protein